VNPRILLATLAMSVLLPTAAQASNVGLLGNLSRTPASDGYPGGGSTGGGVSGGYDFSDAWSIDGSFSLSRPITQPVTEGPLAGKTKGATVSSIGLGASWTPAFDWNPDGQWSLAFGVAFSPKATEKSSTTLGLEQMINGSMQTVDAEALLKATSSSAGASLSLTYDTMGDSNWETAVELSASPNRLATTQTIEEMVTAQGTTVTRDKLLQDCANVYPKQLKLKKTCERLTPLTANHEAAVVSVPITLSIDETIHQNTELSVSGTWYWYSDDPNDVGYFTLASAGRPLPGTTTKAPPNTASFGTGVAIAPYSLRTAFAAAHKIGPVKLSATFGHAEYLDDAGYNNSLGLRANWKITKHWRVSASLATQNDVDADDEATRSYSGSAGVKYTF
jgi:hypothetical protein